MTCDADDALQFLEAAREASSSGGGGAAMVKFDESALALKV